MDCRIPPSNHSALQTLTSNNTTVFDGVFQYGLEFRGFRNAFLFYGTPLTIDSYDYRSEKTGSHTLGEKPRKRKLLEIRDNEEDEGSQLLQTSDSLKPLQLREFKDQGTRRESSQSSLPCLCGDLRTNDN